MEYTLKIDLVGADSAAAKIAGINQQKKALGDDSGKLDAYWRKLEKVDKLAKSIVTGPSGWNYTASPIKKIADESERLAKALERAGQQGKGLDKVGKALLFGGWNYTPGKSSPTDSGAIAAWRASLPPGVVADASNFARGYTGAGGAAPGAGVTDAGGGLASGGKLPPATQEELAGQRKLRAQKEAIEARRRDLMENDAKRGQSDRATFYRELTLLLGPALNPGSGFATMFSARQVFGAFAKTETGGAAMGKFGLSGLGGAAAVTGILVGAATLAGVALKGFTTAVEGAMKAIDKAHALYTQAAQQGVATSFYAQRQALAGLLGVSGNPNQVFMFGKATQELAQRSAYATNILAGNAKALAETSIGFKLLSLDVDALFSAIAVRLAPGMNALTTDAIVLTEILIKMAGAIAWVAKAIGKFFRDLALGPIGGTIIGNLFSKIAAAAGGAGLPNLQMAAKQLPASSLEHMGLIAGGGIGSTVTNQLKQANQHLRVIANAVTGGNLPRTFGMSPAVANP